MKNVNVIVGDTTMSVSVNGFVGFASLNKNNLRQAYYKAYHEARIQATLSLFS